MEQRTHNDIYRELGAASQQIENLEMRAGHHDEALANIKAAVDANAAMVKTVNEQLSRMETTLDAIKTKVLAYDILKSNIRWAVITATTILGAWLASFWAVSGETILSLLKRGGTQ